MSNVPLIRKVRHLNYIKIFPLITIYQITVMINMSKISFISISILAKSRINKVTLPHEYNIQSELKFSLDFCFLLFISLFRVHFFYQQVKQNVIKASHLK